MQILNISIMLLKDKNETSLLKNSNYSTNQKKRNFPDRRRTIQLTHIHKDTEVHVYIF